ncbi:MAG TPA: hypothetical protein VFM70_06560 [Salinimicrobium sp.]|nr:hypothetical protein [Salinimicrobium sp.]
MIENDYEIDNYIDPSLTYDKISDKLKIGQLVLNDEKKKIEKVNLKTLQEIIEFERGNNKKQKYFLLRLRDKWLLSIFDFDAKFLAPQNMTVFTSRKHHLKIHKTQDYRIAYTIRENKGSGGFKGHHHFKPLVMTVNELMDHLYLIKRQVFDFSEKDIEYINEVFKDEIN